MIVKKWMMPLMEADGGTGGAGAAASTGGTGAAAESTAATSTAAEVSFADAVAANPAYKAALEAQIAAAVQKAQEEAQAAAAQREELDKLPDAQKQEKQLTDAVKRAEAAEAKLAAEQNMAHARELLAEKKLPLSFASVLCANTQDATDAVIANFETEFSAAVAAAVKEQIQGYTPGGGQAQGSGTHKDEIKSALFGRK